MFAGLSSWRTRGKCWTKYSNGPLSLSCLYLTQVLDGFVAGAGDSRLLDAVDSRTQAQRQRENQMVRPGI
jgi:hypothetical protein